MSVRKRIQELLEQGHPRDEVVEIIMDEAPGRWPDWRGFFRGPVVALARESENRMFHINNVKIRQAAKSAMLPPQQGRRKERRDDPRMATRDEQIKTMKLKTATGEIVVWGNWTVAQFEAKIQQLRHHVGGLVDHIEALTACITVCRVHGVNRLMDAGTNWPELVRRARSKAPASA